MNNPYVQIAEVSLKASSEFVKTFKQPTDISLAIQLYTEEVDEVVEAAEIMATDPTLANVEAFLKEAADYLYVIGTLSNSIVDYVDIYGEYPVLAKFGDYPANSSQAQGFVMSAITTEGFVTEADMIEVIGRVHASNMSKLGEDGEPIYNADGKVMKGPNYQPPALTDIAERVQAAYIEKYGDLLELIDVLTELQNQVEDTL